MKKIVLFFVLVVSLFAIGPNSSNVNSNLDVQKIFFGPVENGALSENALVLFVFQEGDVSYLLAIEREDGQEIDKKDGILQLSKKVKYITKAIIQNNGDVLDSFSVGFGSSLNFKDVMKIENVKLITPNSSQDYDLNNLFDSSGLFKKEIKIMNLEKGETIIEMR